LGPLTAANHNPAATVGMKLLEIRVVEQVIATNFAAIAMVGVVIGRSENLMKNKIQHQRKISLLDNDRVVKPRVVLNRFGRH